MKKKNKDSIWGFVGKKVAESPDDILRKHLHLIELGKFPKNSKARITCFMY